MEADLISKDATTVRISKVLAERVTRRLAGTEFKSIDGYVAFVLEQVLDEVEGAEQEGTKERRHPRRPEVFSKEEETEVERMLKDLGYL